jgi:hypothetical protein
MMRKKQAGLADFFKSGLDDNFWTGAAPHLFIQGAVAACGMRALRTYASS